MTTLQTAFLSQCDITSWIDPFAATLTLRRVPLNLPTKLSGIARLTQIECSQNFRHFMNVLNKTVYGNAAIRSLKRIRAIPVIEQDQSRRYHYHAAIDRPAHIGREKFQNLIRTSWTRTRWGYNHIHIVMGADEGWLNYMAKSRSKANFCDAIDWENFHNP